MSLSYSLEEQHSVSYSNRILDEHATPSEVDINRELADAVGGLITINGGPHQFDGKAAIWIPNNTVILVPDRTEWTAAPSHRSHLMVTGILTRSDGQYVLSKTAYEWLDK